MVIDAEDYELLQINCIPERIEDNTFKDVKMSAPTVGVNYNINLYFETTLENILKAPRRSDLVYVLQLPIFFNIDDTENCVIDQLYRKHGFETCPTRVFISKGSIWKEMWTHNAWMFIIPSHTTVFVTCGSRREEVALNNSGIIHVTSDCIIQSRLIRLEAKITHEAPTVTHYTKLIVLNNQTINHNTIPHISNETIIPLFATK